MWRPCGVKAVGIYLSTEDFEMKVVTLTVVFLLVTACHHNSKPEASLFDQMGGLPVIEKITENLIDRLLSNEKIAFLFKETVREDLHEKIVDQLCQESGGPCQYEGLDMVEAHSGQDIKYSEFDLFVTDFIHAMEDAGVSYQHQNAMLAIFAPMREDVTHQ